MSRGIQWYELFCKFNKNDSHVQSTTFRALKVSTVKRIWMNVCQIHVRMAVHAMIETTLMFALVHRDMLEQTVNSTLLYAIQVIK